MVASFNIPIEIEDKEFINFLEAIPEEIKKIEGIHEVDLFKLSRKYFNEDRITDMSIDSNANVSSQKSFVNFCSEIEKPYLKLRNYYLLYKYTKERYGQELAEKSLKSVMDGRLYFHDITKLDIPYTYSPKELVTIKTIRGIERITFEELYNRYVKVYEPVKHNEEVETIYPVGSKIKILDHGKWVGLNAITKKVAKRDMVVLYLSDGRTQIVTDNHPIITMNKGEINAIDIEIGDIVKTFDTYYVGGINELNLSVEFLKNNCYIGFTLDNKNLIDIKNEFSVNSPYINGKVLSWGGGQYKINNSLPLTQDFGYIVGLFIAEGSFGNNALSIKQSNEIVASKLVECLNNCGIDFTVYENAYNIHNKALFTLFKNVFNLGGNSQNKKLPKNYLEYNKEFLAGIVAGIIDGDGMVFADRQSGNIRATSRTMLLQVQDVLSILGYKSQFSSLEGIGSTREYNGKTIEQKLPLYRLSFSISEAEDSNIPSVKLLNKRKVAVPQSLFAKLDNPGMVKVVKIEYLTSESIPGGYIYDVTTETGTLDCNNIHSHNCFAGTTIHLLAGGRPYGHLTSKPATRADSFIAQAIEMLMDFSQENAGAIALADLFVNYAWFSKKERNELRKSIKNIEQLAIKYDDANILCEYIYSIAITKGFDFKKEKYQEAIKRKVSEYTDQLITIEDIADFILDKQIENHFQQFVHVANNQFRVGGDSPFSNVSLFDRFILKNTFAEHVYPDGTYAKDNIDEIMRCQYLFAKWFSKGDPTSGLPYRFPITTINVSIDKNGKVRDKEFVRRMAEYNANLGCFNWHIGEKIASCCRMVNDPVRMAKLVRSDTFGNGGTNIGSHRVVAVNLHRVALDSITSGKDIFEVLHDAIEDAVRLLVVHKKDVLARRIKQGFLKFFNIGWQHEKMFFSTIGFTGLADCLEVLGKPITSNEGYVLAEKILEYLENSAVYYSEKEGIPFNTEEIPGESACGKMLQKDKFYYPDLVNREILSNQIFPLSLDIPLYERISMAGRLMDKVSGGSIMHINIKEGYMNPEASAKLIIRIIEKAKVPHFALNFGFSKCEHGHTTKKVSDTCPECGGEIVEKVTRVVGYFSPVSSWSKPRQKEFATRRWFDILGD